MVRAGDQQRSKRRFTQNGNDRFLKIHGVKNTAKTFADAQIITVRKQPSGFESGISYKQGVTGSIPSSPTQALLVTDHDGL